MRHRTNHRRKWAAGVTDRAERDPKLLDPELPNRPITRRDIRNMPKRPAP
jgi:hypothetical protein